MSTELTNDNPQNDQHLLDLEPHLIRADTGLRFANYLIDLIAFYAVIFLAGVLIAMFSPATGDEVANSPTNPLVDRILFILLYALFMSIVEAITNGRSLGKLITGTKAVNLNGSPISAKTAFARGFSRAVPFCAFSAFGSPCNPWQDSWTDTKVIDIKKSTIV